VAEIKTHFFDINADLHDPVEGTEGGACLVGHEGDYINKKNAYSCNYRYQAVERAKSHKEIKKYLHSYNDVIDQIAVQYPDNIPTLARDCEKGIFPAGYSMKIPVPQKHDWDIEGPPKDLQRSYGEKIIAKHNFTRQIWPYWNNAHHLIPKGILKKNIVADEIGPLMEKGLLTEKYNINHGINMLFMPMDLEVGKILDMPRHIQAKAGDDKRVKASCTSHPVYDKMVEEIDNGLKEIIKGYRKAIGNVENCTTPDFKLDKKKLESLSERLLDMILKWEGGRSLDSLACIDEDEENL